MNSPYMGKFKVSQQYKPGVHDGLDLVGIDSKEIHSCANATVIYAGWENPNNHAQGFGYYVATKDITAGSDGIQKIRYYGHLTANSAKVKVGDKVKITDVLGVEGSTGHSTGSHCHYEIRSAFYKGAKVYNVSADSGIPNTVGGPYDDGYRLNTKPPAKPTYSVDSKEDVKKLQAALNSHGYDCGAVDGDIGPKTTKAMFNALCAQWL